MDGSTALDSGVAETELAPEPQVEDAGTSQGEASSKKLASGSAHCRARTSPGLLCCSWLVWFEGSLIWYSNLAVQERNRAQEARIFEPKHLPSHLGE
jgi:hypothetical protein